MRTAKAGRALIAAVVFALLGVALPLRSQGTGEAKQQGHELSTTDIATQLGLKTSPGTPHELNLGASATFTLVDASKLATLGVTGVHAGARVTVTRVGAEKLRMEVDEIEPVELTKKATLKVGQDGKVSATGS